MLLKQKSESILLTFLVVLTCVNLLQSRFTGLLMDESYYWYFSRELAWGYFDHPPMVALCMKIGYTIFQNELGARLMSPFFYSASLYLLWKCIQHPDKNKYVGIYILIGASTALLNAYAFFMLPDSPLIFFATLTLFAYQKYLQKNNYTSMILLAIGFAGMMYSKYHGALFVFFLIASNLSLLRQPRFLITGFIAFLLYVPHILWLYHTDFSSLKYHLFGRADSYYKLSYTTEYLLGLIGIAGLIGPIAFYAAFKNRIKDSFHRSLHFILWGIAIFFLVSSFNRRTQAQWPILILLPLIILTFEYAVTQKAIRKWLYATGLLSLAAISYLRLAVAYEPWSPVIYETHGNQEWVTDLKKKSDGLPVVFENSYRDASMYHFYTGIDTYSLNGLGFRLNQYDMDHSEIRFQHQKVAYVSGRSVPDTAFQITRRYRKKIWNGTFISNFASWRKLQLETEENAIHLGDTIEVRLVNPYEENIPVEKISLHGLVLTEKKRLFDTVPVRTVHPLPKMLMAGDSILFRITTQHKKYTEMPYFRFTISENGLPFGFQGKILNLEN